MNVIEGRLGKDEAEPVDLRQRPTNILDLVQLPNLSETLQWLDETLDEIVESGEHINVQEQFGTTSEVDIAQNIDDLSDETQALEYRAKFLRGSLSHYLRSERDGEALRPVLRAYIKEIICRLQEERYLKGEVLYSEASIKGVIYECVYGHFLWRNEKPRKDGTYYWDTHLFSAMRNTIAHSITGLPNILAAKEHDSGEDLKTHKEGIDRDARGKVRYTRNEWFDCSILYRDQDGFVKEDVDRVMKRTVATVLAMTKPPMEKARDYKERLARDEEALIHYFENLLENGFAAFLKVIEQIQNIQTMDGIRRKSPERAAEKIRIILIVHCLLSKVLQLDITTDAMVDAGVDFLGEDLREWYTNLQNERMIIPSLACLENIAISKIEAWKEAMKYWFAEGVNTADKAQLSAEVLAEQVRGLLEGAPRSRADIDLKELSQQLLEDNRGKGGKESKVNASVDSIRKQIAENFAPCLPEIVRVDVVPTPISRYLDLDKFLADPQSYRPDVPPSDPMCEVLVLVKNDDHRDEVAKKIFSRFDHSEESRLNPNPFPERTADMGTTLKIKIADCDTQLKIRVNSVKQERRSKRGILGKAPKTGHARPIPPAVRKGIKRALHETRLYGRPIIETAKEFILNPLIRVLTDQVKEEAVFLGRGATYLDFAAAIPGQKNALAAVLTGTQVWVRRPGEAAVQKRFLATCHPEDRIVVKTAMAPNEFDTSDGTTIVPDDLDNQIELRLSDFVFAREEQTAIIVRKWFSHSVNAAHAGNASQKSQLKARRERGENYLLELAQLYNISTEAGENDFEVLCLLCKLCYSPKFNNYSGQRNHALEQIGNIKMNPLRVLEKYLREKGRKIEKFKLEIETENTPGNLMKILRPLSENRINVTPVIENEALSSDPSDKSAQLSFECEVPEDLDNYTLLKTILQLTYAPTGETRNVRVVGDIFGFHEDQDLKGKLIEAKTRLEEAT